MTPLHRPRTLTLVICAGLLAAPAAWAGSTLDKVKASGSITLAYREAFIPFSYLDDKAQPVGFGVDICDKVVGDIRRATGRADLKVQRLSVTSANRIPLLVNGTIDLACGSTTNNSDRAKQVAFAINYFYTGTRFLVKADSGIKGPADLGRKVLVSTTGTTNFKLLRDEINSKKLDIELIGAKDHAESALLVQTGRAAAFGMDDPAFKKLVDNTLAGLMKSGEFERLYRKWFLSPIPPKGINLNAAMGRELTDNLKTLSDKPAL